MQINTPGPRERKLQQTAQGESGMKNPVTISRAAARTLEAFWTPVQYLRIGAQYTVYSRSLTDKPLSTRS